jgi:hypothetical protein
MTCKQVKSKHELNLCDEQAGGKHVHVHEEQRMWAVRNKLSKAIARRAVGHAALAAGRLAEMLGLLTATTRPSCVQRPGFASAIGLAVKYSLNIAIKALLRLY